VATLLQQNRRARVEVAKPLLFSGRMEEVSIFINVACSYLSMKMIGESKAMKMAWVLFYMQGGGSRSMKE